MSEIKINKIDTCAPPFCYQTDTMTFKKLLFLQESYVWRRKTPNAGRSWKRSFCPTKRFHTVLIACCTTSQRKLKLRQWWSGHTLTRTSQLCRPLALFKPTPHVRTEMDLGTKGHCTSLCNFPEWSHWLNLCCHISVWLACLGIGS